MRRVAVLAAAAVVVAAGAGLTALGRSGHGSAAAAEDEIARVGGEDRFVTAASVARTHWDHADVAVLASGRDFPDALAAVHTAVGRDAPLLLTEPDRVPAPVADALADLAVDHVVIVGGTAAVSTDVADAVRDSGREVTRIGGADRYHTASQVALEAGTAEEALLASGETFADALAAGTLTAVPPHPPLVLTTPDGAHRWAEQTLSALTVDRVQAMGGPAALADGVLDELRGIAPIERVAGPDRYATSVAAWEEALDRREEAGPLVVATGADFPDGLAAGALAGRVDGTLLMTPPERLSDDVDAAIREHAGRISEVLVVGGSAAVDPFVETEIAAALAGEERPPPPEEPVDVELTELATGLDAPWDVVFRESGEVLVTERDSGRVLELAADGSTTQIHRFDVNSTGEGGLLGLAERPGTGQLYAYYTRAAENRITRFEPGGGEHVILDGIPRGSIHNGGRLAFGPDGMLYAATGDAGDGSRSQDADDPAGAILRLEPDGGIPDDNPFEGSPVYATGIRNSQGLAWDADGRLWATEFGPGADDEINVISAGGDYGWPEVTGVSGRGDLVDPVFVRQPPQASWSGIAVLVDGAIPQWEGDVFAAGLRGERLWRLSVDGAEVTGAEELLAGQHGRLREVTQAPDGSLWVLTNNTDGRGDPGPDDDRILRLGPGFEGAHGPLSGQLRAAMEGTSWEEGCPVGPDELTHVTVVHWDFGLQRRLGELVVADELAQGVVEVFGELYAARFPLTEVATIDVYDGDDDAAMAANASTAFNCRRITGGEGYSEHAFGTAIDLNPRQNPYRRDDVVLPPAGVAYLDRDDVRAGMITESGPVAAAFDARGWVWGGRWSSPQDWMHFERR